MSSNVTKTKCYQIFGPGLVLLNVTDYILVARSWKRSVLGSLAKESNGDSGLKKSGRCFPRLKVSNGTNHHKQLIAAWNTLGKKILYIFLRPLVQRTFQLWIIMYKFHNCSHHEVYTKLGELIFAIYWPLINGRQYPQECFWLGIKCIQTYPFTAVRIRKNCSEGRVF